MEKPNPVDQTRLTLAAVTACLIRSLDEEDAGLQRRFRENIEKVYQSLRDDDVAHTGAMETLGWIKQFLKKLS